MPSVSTKAPLRQRITWQMVLFFSVPAVIFGFIGYQFFKPDIRLLNNGLTEVDLKAMSTFDFDQNNGRLQDIPQRWRDLDGKKVLVRGEMYVSDEAGDQIHHFDLVYSIAKCCFSGVPQVQHFVKSKPVSGLVPNYGNYQVDVVGTLHVNVKKDEGKVASIYQLDVEDVKPVM